MIAVGMSSVAVVGNLFLDDETNDCSSKWSKAGLLQ